MDVELREDGGIRVFVGRMTDSKSRQLGDDRWGVLDGLAIAYAARLVEWSRSIAKITGYRGSWMFGISADGLRGRQSIAPLDPSGSEEGPTYDEDEYRATTTATQIEIEEHSERVVLNLVGSLLRGLGSDMFYRTQVEYVPSR